MSGWVDKWMVSILMDMKWTDEWMDGWMNNDGWINR